VPPADWEPEKEVGPVVDDDAPDWDRDEEIDETNGLAPDVEIDGGSSSSRSGWLHQVQQERRQQRLMPVLQELCRHAYLKCDKYRDACVAAQGWLSKCLRGSMAIGALLHQPGSEPLKEVLGPALEGQLADVATGQAMLELLIHLQTEADMERASAATEHSDPAGVELAPADADEWDVGLAPVDEDEWDVGLAPADAHEPNGDAVADADADASGAAPAGFAAEPDRPDEPDADVGQARWVQGDNRLWTKRNGPNGLAPCPKLPLGPPPPRLLVAAPDGPSDFEQHFFGGPFWAPRAWAHGGPGPGPWANGHMVGPVRARSGT